MKDIEKIDVSRGKRIDFIVGDKPAYGIVHRVEPNPHFATDYLVTVTLSENVESGPRIMIDGVDGGRGVSRPLHRDGNIFLPISIPVAHIDSCTIGK